MYAVLIDSLLHLYQFWGDASWMNGPRQITLDAGVISVLSEMVCLPGRYCTTTQGLFGICTTQLQKDVVQCDEGERVTSEPRKL
jgi:hypothetical protein